MLQTGPDGPLGRRHVSLRDRASRSGSPRTGRRSSTCAPAMTWAGSIRIYPEGKKPRPVPALERLDDRALVAALASPNGWTARHAQTLLSHRQAKGQLREVIALYRKSADPKVRLQALATGDALTSPQDPALWGAEWGALTESDPARVPLCHRGTGPSGLFPKPSGDATAAPYRPRAPQELLVLPRSTPGRPTWRTCLRSRGRCCSARTPMTSISRPRRAAPSTQPTGSRSWRRCCWWMIGRSPTTGSHPWSAWRSRSTSPGRRPSSCTPWSAPTSRLRFAVLAPLLDSVDLATVGRNLALKDIVEAVHRALALARKVAADPKAPLGDRAGPGASGPGLDPRKGGPRSSGELLDAANARRFAGSRDPAARTDGAVRSRLPPRLADPGSDPTRTGAGRDPEPAVEYPAPGPLQRDRGTEGAAAGDRRGTPTAPAADERPGATASGPARCSAAPGTRTASRSLKNTGGPCPPCPAPPTEGRRSSPGPARRAINSAARASRSARTSTLSATSLPTACLWRSLTRIAASSRDSSTTW